MSTKHVLGAIGLTGAFALICIGATGAGVGRWWGSGRLGRLYSIVLGVAFALANISSVISMSDTGFEVTSLASIALIFVVLFRKQERSR